MTEFVERMNLDKLVFDDDLPRRSSDPFSPGKIMGVAVLGAAAALSAYYIYNQMDPAKKARIRDGVVSFARSQVKNFTEEQ